VTKVDNKIIRIVLLRKCGTPYLGLGASRGSIRNELKLRVTKVYKIENKVYYNLWNF